jgi:NDP-sugar pyrophosphorylase family protein
MKKPKQAVILAGGKGSRLEPLTKYCPKPLVDINGYPFILFKS